MQNNDSAEPGVDFIKSAEMKDSFFPDDWDNEDIEFLAEFLSHYNLGELGRILDPANEYDYRLYTPADSDSEDEDVEHTINQFDTGIGRGITTPGSELSNGPPSGRRDLGGGFDE